MNETMFCSFLLLILFLRPVANDFYGEAKCKGERNAFPPGLFAKRKKHHGKAEKAHHYRECIFLREISSEQGRGGKG
jgi:hypothetical protein